MCHNVAKCVEISSCGYVNKPQPDEGWTVLGFKVGEEIRRRKAEEKSTRKAYTTWGGIAAAFRRAL